MPICPSSLEELSLDCLVANVQDFVEHKKGEVDDEEAVDPLVRPPASSPAEWPPLPAEVGNKLLNKVRERGSLNQHSLKFFTSDRVRLTEVDLTACEVSLNSLRVLRDHRLDSLSLFRMKIANSSRLDLLALIDECLHPDTTRGLRRLNVGGPEPIERLRMLSRFSGLTSLVVAESPVFDSTHLRTVCGELRHLRCLDISKTAVDDISSVETLCDCLETLIMHRVHIAAYLQEKTLAALKSLHRLRSLDVSDRRTHTDDTLAGRLADDIITAITVDGATWWGHLESFDFSGNELNSDAGLDVICVRLARFLALHANLRFVGVLDTAISPLPYLARIDRLQIAGSASRVQCIQSVQTYWRPDREAFTAHALQSVYYELQSAYDEFNLHDIRTSAKGIELSMRHHRTNLSVQMAGSACLYHLCRFQRGKALTSEQIRLCVDRCLDAAESHPKIIQLQKNVWLTLCNDYLLQTKNFDMCRTCEVAMEAMVTTRDPSVSRMTIAIVSILAPKIPTDRSHALATNVRYIRYLIDVINEKLAEPSVAPANNNLFDFTLKFTLSALWNLTDESPETCELFLKQGGLNTVLQALIRFNTSLSIQTKVLGLLNNVAEVSTLQSYMVEPFCLKTILELLKNDQMDANGNQQRIDVSYFAAGILANLLLAPPWDFEPNAQLCNRTLVEAVEGWGTPDNTMVAYRSFSPFYPLLDRDDLAGSQLWAVWAVRHVCSKDKDRGYIQMLHAQNGYQAVSRLFYSPFSSPSAKRIAGDILRLLDNIPAQSPHNRSSSHRH